MPRRFLRFRPPHALALMLLMAFQTQAEISVRKAVFSDRQLFWPALAGHGRPAAAPSAPADRRTSAAQKAKADVPGKTGQSEPMRLAVLPIDVKDYSETLPCDSCHRLSANGMEFYLENYLRQRMEARFPGQHVELVAPSDPLVAKWVDLMPYLDSLRLPWDKWLSDPGEAVVYRPRDRFTDPPMRRRMDKLGGILGATHLLLPARVHVKVKPMGSNMHLGGLEWGCYLLLWNVAEGRPEWVLDYEESESTVDLDESLDGRLDRALGTVFEKIPAELQELWAAEPH
ncbi:MAG: hypothetical protein JF616_20585 [Fibrobacteres bacterium]|nr:hypothetical protein [Fibrobacterota bacterium]